MGNVQCPQGDRLWRYGYSVPLLSSMRYARVLRAFSLTRAALPAQCRQVVELRPGEPYHVARSSIFARLANATGTFRSNTDSRGNLPHGERRVHRLAAFSHDDRFRGTPHATAVTFDNPDVNIDRVADFRNRESLRRPRLSFSSSSAAMSPFYEVHRDPSSYPPLCMNPHSDGRTADNRGTHRGFLTR